METTNADDDDDDDDDTGDVSVHKQPFLYTPVLSAFKCTLGSHFGLCYHCEANTQEVQSNEKIKKLYFRFVDLEKLLMKS